MGSASLSQDDQRPLVLLIEDRVLVRTELALALETAGFRVVPVAGADEATQVLGSFSGIAGAVIGQVPTSDHITALELVRRVQSEHGIGVVVLREPTRPQPDEPFTGVLYLAEPVHPPTLVEIVRAVVARQGQQPPPPAETDAGVRDDVSLPLTPRQLRVLELLTEGKSNQEIAQALGLSVHTVKVHLVAVYRILGVSSRTEAAMASLGLRGR